MTLDSTDVASRVASDADFASGGFARTNYTSSELWQRLFRQLEVVADRFSSLVWPGGRRNGYGWPIDPLHWWSRTWEYPFVAAKLDQLSRELGRSAGTPPRLLDVGAAVTFYTFWLLQHNIDVTCLDYDPEMIRHFGRAWRFAGEPMLSERSQPPRYIIGDARATTLPGSSFDLVTCISVLEHIPGWERAIEEMHRLLVPGGWLILTFDVRLNEHANGLSMEELARIIELLGSRFHPSTRIETSLPANALRTSNAPMPTPPAPPCPFEAGVLLRKLWRPTRVAGWMRRKIVPRRLAAAAVPDEPEELAIYSGVWQKR